MKYKFVVRYLCGVITIIFDNVGEMDDPSR